MLRLPAGLSFGCSAWGGGSPSITEVTQQGVVVFEAVLSLNCHSYRAYKFPWGTTTSTGKNTGIPGEFELRQNYPNPFNPQTKIKYTVSKASFTELTIYDITGRVVSKPVSGYEQPGSYEIIFDGSDLSSGMYFYRLQSGYEVSVKKMMLVK